MKKLCLIVLTALTAWSLAAAETFRRDSYDAMEYGFIENNDDVLNPDGGSVEFTFTGKFDRYQAGGENLYILMSSGRFQLGVQQLGSGRLRLYCEGKRADGKGFAVNKLAAIASDRPFHIRLEWDKTGARLLCNGKLQSKLDAVPFQWGDRFMFGSMGGARTLRLARGKFENIVITAAETAAPAPAPAAVPTAPAPGHKVTFRRDSYDAMEYGFIENNDDVLNPDGGSVEFTFTGKFDRYQAGGENLYILMSSGRFQLGVQQLGSGRLRLYCEGKRADGKGFAVNKLAAIASDRPFHIRLEWDKTGARLLCNGKLQSELDAVPFQWGDRFMFGSMGGARTIRLARGKFENIVITAAEPEPIACVERIGMDFETGDLSLWRMDSADGEAPATSVDRTHAFTGDASLRVEKKSPRGDFEFTSPLPERMAVRKGQPVRLSVRYRLENIADAAISCGFKLEDRTGRVLDTKLLVGGGRRSLRNYMRTIAMLPEKSWREFSAVYKPARNGYLSFFVTGGDGVFALNLDRVSAENVTEGRPDRIFYEDFSALNFSDDALAGRDFFRRGATLTRTGAGLKVGFPGALVWETDKLHPRVEYRLTVDGDATASGAVAELRFRDIAAKTLAEYRKPLNGGKCVFDFEVPPTASLTELKITGPSGSAVIRSIAADKNFTVNAERGIHHNEWQGHSVWDGTEKGLTAIRRTFTLDAPPAEAYIRFLGHNGAQLFVNSRDCGKGGQFAPGVADAGAFLREGRNVIAMLVSCSSGGKKGMFELYARDVNGKEYFIVSDDKAKVRSGKPEGNWTAVDFSDADWSAARVREGSARDFGNGGLAAIVNTRREGLYIGPRDLAEVESAVYSRSIPADGEFKAELKGRLPSRVRGGRMIFTRGAQVFRMEIAPEEIVSDGKTLSVVFAPRFLPPGKFDCALELFRVRFASGIELKLGELTVGPMSRLPHRPRAEIRQVNGKPILHIDGKPHTSGMFCTGRPYSPEVRETNDQMEIKVHQIYINVRTIKPYISNGDVIDDRSGKYDFSITEQILIDAAAQLRHDPDAYIIPLIGCDIPKDFSTDPKRQDDLLVTGKGFKLWIDGPKRLGKVGQPYKDMSEIPPNSRVSVSHASEAKKKVYTDMIRATVRHFENSPIAEKIIGYGVSGEMDQQLYPYIPYGGYASTLGRGDYSPVMLRYFREFLRKKYGTDAALQAAWSDPKVTLDTAEIPSDREREGEPFFVNRAVADYVAAFSRAQLDLTGAMTRTIKDETGGRCIVWLYPGDSASISGAMHYGYHGLSVSTGIEQYRERSVDLFGNPGNYTLRRNGLPSAQYGAPASARLNNKIWSPEMDLRSFVIGAYSTSWGPPTLFESRAHWAKEMMCTLKYGMGYRIYTFWPGWLNNAGIKDEVRLLQNISRKQLALPLRWKPEVCLLIDSTGIENTGDFTNRRMHFYYGGTGAIGACEIMPSGAQFDVCYLQDILRDDFPADQYKVYVFSGLYRADAAMRAAIRDKLRKPGKFLIWRWGEGYLNEHNQVDPAAVRELTGFKVKRFTCAKALPEAVVDKASPYTAGMVGATVASRYRYHTDPALPFFTLDDPQTDVLARFTSGEAILGVKSVGEAIGIYTALPALPARMLRNIFRASGVHVYVDNDHDFVSTDGNFLALHSGVGGEKTVRLPEKVARVVDLHTGKIVAENTDVLRFTMRPFGTEIFEIIR